MSKQPNIETIDKHPKSGELMTGADTVIQVLADEGVDTMFGYSGGAILPIYDAVFRYNDDHKRPDGSSAIPLIVPANEQGAGFMAAGYARASGKVGVVTPGRDLRPGTNGCDRYRCISGSTRCCHHGGRREARVPGYRPGTTGRNRTQCF
jgi:hypothetical protein